MGTQALVDPRDIRDDTNAALRGLMILKGAELERITDEVYKSRTNSKIGFWASWFNNKDQSEYPRRWTRRQIAKWVAELVDRDVIKSDNNPLDWWTDGGCAMSQWEKKYKQPVIELIQVAASVNTTEIIVDATTLQHFDAAYEAGFKPSEPT